MVPLREQGATYEGQANVGRPQARSCRCHSARGMEPRLQPKTGRLNLQAAVDSASAGRSRSSRKQARVHYTLGIKPTGVRRSKHCIGTRGPHWHMLASQPLTRSTETVPGRASEQVRCKRQQVAHRGKWPAACRPPAFGGLLPGGSSQTQPDWHSARGKKRQRGTRAEH